jgi:hypothetical protein
MLSLKLLFYFFKIIFIIATWNFKSKIIILSLEFLFLLLQLEISSLKLLFYLLKNQIYYRTLKFPIWRPYNVFLGIANMTQ